jgi:hypothetical protein
MGFLTNPSLHRAKTFSKVSKRKKKEKVKKYNFLNFFGRGRKKVSSEALQKKKLLFRLQLVLNFSEINLFNFKM